MPYFLLRRFHCCVGLLDAVSHRRHRVALQIHIERGVDPIRIGLEIAILKAILQRLVHQIDEIRRVASIRLLRASTCQRRSRGVLDNPLWVISPFSRIGFSTTLRRVLGASGWRNGLRPMGDLNQAGQQSRRPAGSPCSDPCPDKRRRPSPNP